jgi:hypothetical protein
MLEPTAMMVRRMWRTDGALVAEFSADGFMAK